MAATKELAGVGRLLGLILLRELDRETLTALEDPPLAAGLEAMGIELPCESLLEELAAEYFQYFISPEKGTPLVQSLHQGGSYEGTAAVEVRKVAKAAGVELSEDHLRGAPIDHLAVELFLWSELVERDEAAAAEFAKRHLSWGLGPLNRGEREGFYRSVGGVTASFIEMIGGEET